MMKKIFFLAVASFFAMSASASDSYIPKLKAQEYRNLYGCPAFTNSPIREGRATLQVSLYETCDSEISFEAGVFSTGPFTSSINDYKLDCKERKAGWLGVRYFHDQFWRSSGRYSAATKPILFMPFDTDKIAMFNRICDDFKIIPSS